MEGVFHLRICLIRSLHTLVPLQNVSLESNEQVFPDLEPLFHVLEPCFHVLEPQSVDKAI